MWSILLLMLLFQPMKDLGTIRWLHMLIWIFIMCHQRRSKSALVQCYCHKKNDLAFRVLFQGCSLLQAYTVMCVCLWGLKYLTVIYGTVTLTICVSVRESLSSEKSLCKSINIPFYHVSSCGYCDLFRKNVLLLSMWRIFLAVREYLIWKFPAEIKLDRFKFYKG